MHGVVENAPESSQAQLGTAAAHVLRPEFWVIVMSRQVQTAVTCVTRILKYSIIPSRPRYPGR